MNPAWINFLIPSTISVIFSGWINSGLIQCWNSNDINMDRANIKTSWNRHWCILELTLYVDCSIEKNWILFFTEIAPITTQFIMHPTAIRYFFKKLLISFRVSNYWFMQDQNLCWNKWIHEKSNNKSLKDLFFVGINLLDLLPQFLLK